MLVITTFVPYCPGVVIIVRRSEVGAGIRGGMTEERRREHVLFDDIQDHIDKLRTIGDNKKV